MDAQTAPRPTGRRKITPAQAAAEAAGPVPLPPTKPGRVLAAFKRAAPALGVSRRVVDLIDTLFSVSFPQDWDGGPGPGPIVWMNDVTLRQRLGVERTQLKAHVNAALDGGFIRLRRSANGKRWGKRDRDAKDGGRITAAYGFDLAPLGERVSEFEHAAAEAQARHEEGKRLRAEIGSRRGHILSLVDLAVAQGLEGEDWPDAAERAEALMRERGEHYDPLALVPIAARMKALDIRVQEQVTAALEAAVPPSQDVSETVVGIGEAADVEQAKSGHTDPSGSGHRPHYITTTQLLTAKAGTTVPTEVGPNRPEAQRERGSGDLPSRRATAEQRRGGPVQATVAAGGTNIGNQPTRASAAPSCALGGFSISPGLILQIAPIFRDWTRSARPGWDELARAADDIRSVLGISPPLWREAVNALGDDGAISALAVTCTRHAADEIRTTPGAYLGGMMRKHRAGKLRLDRTLFGLAEKANGGRRRAGS